MEKMKKQKKILDYVFDFALVLALLVMVFQFGKFAGRDDAYIAGFISGYDFYYKGAYYMLLDSIQQNGGSCEVLRIQGSSSSLLQQN